MKIKQLSNVRTPLDIKEWNDEVRAYIKPLDGFERLVFNDLFVTFYNRKNEPEQRFDAGFRAALLALVDDENRPLFTEADRENVRAGSFLPFFRLFNVALNSDGGANSEPLETTKKN